MASNARKEQILPFVFLIDKCSAKWGLPADVVAGLVLTESSGNPWAIRVERGFWRRYYEGVKANVLRSKSAYDDKWIKYPDIASCSYGLCQIMLPVAWENGFIPKFPTELLDPEDNIDLGCKILSRHLHRVGSIHKALLRYNGGGDPEYPHRVMEAAKSVSDLFRT
jgi:hypothetical protein